MRQGLGTMILEPHEAPVEYMYCGVRVMGQPRSLGAAKGSEGFHDMYVKSL
jgi:hypothetical protein